MAKTKSKKVKVPSIGRIDLFLWPFSTAKRVTPKPNCTRGLEDDGLTEPVIGWSLGIGYTDRHGVKWVAVHWDDEDDPNWFKEDCLDLYRMG